MLHLGEVCEINPATDFDFGPDDACGFVPMEAVDDVDACIEKPATRPFKEVAKGYTPFADRDVIVAKITHCMENGKRAIAYDLRSGVGFGSTEFHVLRASKHVLPDWLFCFWRFPPTRKLAAKNMTGSAGQKRVPTSFLETVAIPLPSLTDQQRIAGQLEEADRLRRTRRYALELADSLLPAAFLQLFGDSVRNPHSFAMVELGDALDIPPGLDATRPCAPEGEYRRARAGEVGGDGVELNSCAFVSLSEVELKRFQVLEGDILLARAIGSEEHLGKLSICQPLAGTLVYDSHLMRLRTRPAKLLPSFLVVLLRSHGGRTLFMRQARRTAVQFNINCEQLSELRLPVPPLALQRRFAAMVERVERLKPGLPTLLASVRQLRGSESRLQPAIADLDNTLHPHDP